jgi:DNA-binding CsgD family transcriptional regulator/tetratricopeptide (TPR) repeat protein
VEEASAAGRTGLYERETELSVLSRALTRAQSGHGGLVVLEGPAGIGKSRLLIETRAMALAQRMTCLGARGVDLERDASFGVAADLFAGLLATADQAERDRLLSGQAALAAVLFDPGLSPEPDPTGLVRGLYWLTANAAATPLVITVDDAQWADQPSMSYLAHLAARIEDLPVLLVIALRSGEQAAADQPLEWLKDQESGALLHPGALTPEAVAVLTRQTLPTAGPAFITACAEVSGGNPFLATELLRALRADGITPTDDAVDVVRSLVPDSVLRAVLVRLARLGPAAQELARAVAVLGDRAPIRQAERLASLAANEAEQAADALAGAHILSPGEPLRFTHPLIATSVYADIPAFARSRAHRTAADLLTEEGAPSDLVAAQLLHTRPNGDQRTVSILHEAAARALTRGHPGAATRLLQRALSEPPAPPVKGTLLLELAKADPGTDGERAEAHIGAALPFLTEPQERAHALATLGQLRFRHGAQEAAASAMEEALELLQPDDPELPLLLTGYLTVSTYRAGLHARAAARIQPLLAAARAGHLPAHLGLLALLTLRLALTDEPGARIRELAERATVADPFVHPASLGTLHGFVVSALYCTDELESAERIGDAAIAAARQRGTLLTYTVASYHRAVARYLRGELASAVADLEQAQVAAGDGLTALGPATGVLLVHIHLERGDLAAARDALTLAQQAAPGSMNQPRALCAQARLELATGQPVDALEHAQEAGELLAVGFGIDHPGFMSWRPIAALAARALGEHARARELAAAMVERARRSGVPRSIGQALRTQAAVTGGADRIALLEEAADVIASSPAALERAHILVDLGAARRQAGQRAAAELPLREGLQLAAAMGAAPLAETARRELHALGLRPRRPALSGPDALTPTERRVAELAGSGLTNRQTAEALFVTVKTVETHLARVYHKLGISTRADLLKLTSPSR